MKREYAYYIDKSIRLLSKYRYRLSSIDTIEEELREISAKKYKIRSATVDGSPVQGGGNAREEALLSILDQEEDLRDSLHDAKRLVERVEKGLDQLDARHRRVLELMYIDRQYGAARRLAEELHESEAEIYRDKDEALMQFAEARFGRIDM